MPTIHSWELDDFYRQVRKSLLELEDAFARHELDLRLRHRDFQHFGGTAVATAYRRLCMDAPERFAELRLESIRALLEHLRQELFCVESVARAELAFTAQGKPVVRVQHAGEAIDLRFDQFLSARAWGRGLEFDDVEADQAFAELVAHNACTQLAFDLRSLQRIFYRFTPRATAEPLRVVPRPAERAFERLMVDILNEHAETVWQARIDEDFLEKVDLRIAAPDPTVVEGVGIQVTQVSKPELYAQKLGKIRHVERFVILPPEVALKYAPYYFPVDLSAGHGVAAEFGQLRLAATRLLESLGWPTAALSFAGIIVALRVRPAWAALLLSAALAYYVVSVRAMLSLSLRYLMPITLIATMFAGISLGTLLERGTGSWWRRSLAALLLLYIFAYGWDVNRMMKGDARYQAENWITAEAGEGARIEVYQNATYLPRFPDSIKVDNVDFEARTVEEFRKRSPDFIVLSSAGLSGVSVQYKQDWHESEDTEQGYIEGKKSAAGIVMTYQRRANVEFLAALADGSLGYREAARFSVEPWIPRTLIQSLNPEILIYRRAAPAADRSAGRGASLDAGRDAATKPLR